MRFRFTPALLIVGLLASSAFAQGRRDRDSRDRERDRDRSSNRPAGSGAATESPITDENPDKTSFERYTVLSDHNIFMKNRVQRSRGPTTREAPRDPPRRPEQAFVLTGCVIENDDKWMAFVENAQTGATQKVAVGESIATGKVVAIGFDFLEYETGGQRTRVEIGHNFTGTAASASTFIPSLSTTGPTTGPVDESNLSIEERLKRKRQRELSGGR